MPADENVLVFLFGGDHRLGTPGFAAAVDAFAGGVAHDVVADGPVLPGAGAEGAELRPVWTRGAPFEDEALDLDIPKPAAMRSEDAIASRDLDRTFRGGALALEMHQ